MALEVRPLQPAQPGFAAEVTGTDLRELPGPALADTIERLMDEFAVIVLRDQAIDDDQQFAFASALGTLEPTPAVVDGHKRRLKHAQMVDISNLEVDGSIIPSDDRRRMFNLGNMLWHSDSSFKATPAKYSMLHARAIPPRGGETEFADMRAAWDALAPDVQTRIEHLVCDHSLIYSRALLGFDAFTPEEQKDFAPVPQRLVRRHPVTGRRSIFLSSHIGTVHGLQRPEAMMLIRDLTEHATQRQFVYAHPWRVHDLVIWDNRCTMHRARPYDDRQFRRDMRRLTLEDVAPSLQQAA